MRNKSLPQSRLKDLFRDFQPLEPGPRSSTPSPVFQPAKVATPLGETYHRGEGIPQDQVVPDCHTLLISAVGTAEITPDRPLDGTSPRLIFESDVAVAVPSESDLFEPVFTPVEEIISPIYVQPALAEKDPIRESRSQTSRITTERLPARRRRRFRLARWEYIVLFAVFLSTILFTGYSLLNTPLVQSNADFYQLSQPWTQEAPFATMVGKPEVVMVVIHNSAQVPTSFLAKVFTKDQLVGAAGPFVISPNDTIYTAVDFLPVIAGQQVPLTVELIRGEDTQHPYRTLDLWLNVNSVDN